MAKKAHRKSAAAGWLKTILRHFLLLYFRLGCAKMLKAWAISTIQARAQNPPTSIWIRPSSGHTGMGRQAPEAIWAG
jgi:hypothetical protein